VVSYPSYSRNINNIYPLLLKKSLFVRKEKSQGDKKIIRIIIKKNCNLLQHRNTHSHKRAQFCAAAVPPSMTSSLIAANDVATSRETLFTTTTHTHHLSYRRREKDKNQEKKLISKKVTIGLSF